MKIILALLKKEFKKEKNLRVGDECFFLMPVEFIFNKPCRCTTWSTRSEISKKFETKLGLIIMVDNTQCM
jgi:hypothetical protein